MASRPAQGNNSTPVKLARPAYQNQSAPRPVSQGTVSRPTDKPGRPRYQNQPAPRRVKNAATF